MSNSKQNVSSSKSKTGDGHQMSKIDVQNELAKQERELFKSYKGYECACEKCGEKFSISTDTNTFKDHGDLIQHLTDGGCPSCLNWKTDQWHAKRNYLLEFKFFINGREIKALRVPNGYRAKKIIKVDDKGRALL